MAANGSLHHAPRRRTLAGHQVPHRAAVGVGIGHQLQQPVLHPQQIPGSRPLRSRRVTFIRRRRPRVVGRPPVEDPQVDPVDGDPGLGQQRRDHLRVEGDLQPVLDLGRRRAFHIGDQDLQRARRIAREPQHVDVATDVPAAEGDEQPRLEDDERLPGGEVPRQGHDALVVVGREPGTVDPVRQVDGAEARRHGPFDLLLERARRIGSAGEGSTAARRHSRA